MKVKHEDSGKIEYVKILKCEGCDSRSVTVDGKQFNASELLANGWQFAEITREEMNEFNEFMSDVTFHLRETWDFFEGRMAQVFGDQDSEDENDNGHKHVPK